MRLDKFLKVSRVIKRRTVANEACDGGHVKVNDKLAKASYDVKENDIVEISFGQRVVRFRVLDVREHALKADAMSMYEILQDEKV
ncbi:MAG: RNA-binding S4 domain-containing protein [Clostridiales bacterium]|nr:RNA-binding S4 domain-containing protein [Clostridiales bacterium]